MRFHSIASGSSGNAYLLTAEGVAPLLVEAGIPIKQLQAKLRALRGSIGGLAGCCVSHSHMDHAKAVKDLLKYGVDCYMSKETADALNVSGHHRLHEVEDGKVQIIDAWRVLPFPLIHDVPCFGFLIGQREERLLFIPDTAYVVPKFIGITQIVVECNYCSDILAANIQNGSLPDVVGHRVRRAHMSLDTVIALLKANDLSQCRQIHLIHLSDGNSDEARMVDEVQEAVGIPTRAC